MICRRGGDDLVPARARAAGGGGEATAAGELMPPPGSAAVAYGVMKAQRLPQRTIVGPLIPPSYSAASANGGATSPATRENAGLPALIDRLVDQFRYGRVSPRMRRTTSVRPSASVAQWATVR